MSKKPVKKKTVRSAGKSVAKKGTKKVVKTASKRSKGAKTPVKKKKTTKELETRAANLIANTEKKKKKAVSAKRVKRTLSKEQAFALADAVIEGMREKKAKNIMLLDLKNIENRVSDVFVICDADSKTHVSSIADSVEEMVGKLTGEKAFHSEGHENSEWILVDYVNVVAHIFLREVREHYNIEGLWGDAKFTLINN